MSAKFRLEKLEQAIGPAADPAEAEYQAELHTAICLLIDAFDEKHMPDRLYDALIAIGWLRAENRGNTEAVTRLRDQFVKLIEERHEKEGRN